MNIRSPAILSMLIMLLPVSNAAAQEGVPGARIETGRDHRALVRAEAYTSATAFLTRWREAWRKRDVDALAKLYTDDASIRLPGRPVVRTKQPLIQALRSAMREAAPVELLNVDFESDGETATIVSCYSTRRGGTEVTGLMTAVLFRVGRGWKFRMHLFDTPQPVGNANEISVC